MNDGRLTGDWKEFLARDVEMLMPDSTNLTAFMQIGEADKITLNGKGIYTVQQLCNKLGFAGLRNHYAQMAAAETNELLKKYRTESVEDNAVDTWYQIQAVMRRGV